MTRTEKAIDLFNQGFHTKADQKRCLELLGRAYSDVRDIITKGILNLRDTTNMSEALNSELYWLLPYDLHQFRTKHAEALNFLFPNEIAEIAYLANFRNDVKNAPIVKVEKDTVVAEKVEQIEKSLEEIYQTQKDQYERGLAISKIFGGLPVSVTPHWVFRDGSQFKRYFYFLAGKLTALNTILAVAQTLEDEKKK